MNMQPIGDLARSLVARSQSSQLKMQQARLTQELSTGQTSDPVRTMRGDLRQVAGLERDLVMQAGWLQNTKELGQIAGAIQTSLDTVGEVSDALMQTLVIGPQSQLVQASGLAKEQAVAGLGTMFSALNTQFAGRHIFSGDDFGTPPLPDPQAFFDAIETATSGIFQPEAIVQALDAFFADGGQFDTMIYQGGQGSVSPAPIDERETVDLTIKATDQPFRDMIKASALAFAAGNAGTAIAPDDQRDLLHTARDLSLSANTALAEQRGRIGIAQERIEFAQVRLQTRSLETEKARNDLLGVDAFDVATRLEDTNARLELLYATTARAARLSFLEFMR